MEYKGFKRAAIWMLILCLGVTTALTGVPESLMTDTPREVSAASYPKLKTVDYEPTGFQRVDIVGYARTQIGYAEKGNNNNYFGAWYGMNYNPWCAMFVSWCAAKAGVPRSILPRQANADREWAKDQKVYHKSKSFGGTYIPKSGDLIYFSWTGRDWAEHIGIVSGCAVVDGTRYVYTIEGNKHDKVVTGTYKWNNSYILGYASPKYTTTLPENGYILKYRENVSDSNKTTTIGTFGEFLPMAGKVFTKKKYTYSYWKFFRISSSGDPVYLYRDDATWTKEVWCKPANKPAGYHLVKVARGGQLKIYTKVNDVIYTCPCWKIKKYSITYKANGGRVVPAVQMKTYGKKIKISKKKPTWAGYKFKGYATKKNSKKVVYKPGQTYKKNKKLTLYAVWKPLKGEFKVRVLKDGGLNVRSGPGFSHKVVKMVKKGKVLKIVKVRKGWGKIKGTNRWIMLYYTKKIK